MSEPQLIDLDFLRTIPLPEYSDDADKADYGKLLIIAGSQRLPGPAILAARAALRTGCGTVRVAAPVNVAPYIGIAVPELMVVPLPRTSSGTVASGALPVIQEQYEPCDAAIIGPGLDENDETDELARQLVQEIPLPLVVDAQALGALNRKSPAPAAARVITPHLGEMSALSQQTVEDIEANRETVARDYARASKSIVVLKGRDTLIAAPDGILYKNTAGTRGLGTAGSGDVLAGVIGSLLAQRMEPAHAAVWGVHLHALAGEAAAKDLGDDGIMASDLIEHLPGVLRYLRRLTSPASQSRPGLRIHS